MTDRVPFSSDVMVDVLRTVLDSIKFNIDHHGEEFSWRINLDREVGMNDLEYSSLSKTPTGFSATVNMKDFYSGIWGVNWNSIRNTIGVQYYRKIYEDTFVEDAE